MLKVLAGILLVAAHAGVYAQTIRAVTEATPETYLKDGKAAGRVTELVELTLQRAGLTKYTISVYPWARSYDIALKEANVLIYMIVRTPDREARFKWVGEFHKSQYHLYKLKERKEIVATTLTEAKNYTIGVLKDDVRHQYLQHEGFTRLDLSAQRIDNFNQLIYRRVDMIPLDDQDLGLLCETAHFNCANLERVLTILSTGQYMAFSKSTPDAIVERARAAFDTIRADGTLRKAMEKPP